MPGALGPALLRVGPLTPAVHRRSPPSSRISAHRDTSGSAPRPSFHATLVRDTRDSEEVPRSTLFAKGDGPVVRVPGEPPYIPFPGDAEQQKKWEERQKAVLKQMRDLRLLPEGRPAGSVAEH